MGKSKGSKKRAKEDVGYNVNADVTMAAAVRKVREILSEQSEQEIREMLLQCGGNHYEAIERLVSQQELRNQQGGSNQLPDSSTTSSVLVPNQSAITNGESRNVPVSFTEVVPSLSVPSSSDVTNGETRTVAISSSEAVPPLSSETSSSAITNGETRSVPTRSVPTRSVPSSSATINGEARSVPTSSNVAVRPLSVSSSRVLTKVKPKIQDTMMISDYGPPMAEVLRRLHIPSKQNLIKAPVLKADSPLLPISNSVTKSDAAKDPQYSPFSMDTRQSIATASPLDPRPPTFMAQAFGKCPSSEPHINQQGMNWGQYGNMINSPYIRRPAQNKPPPAPIEKRGGSNRNSNTLARHVNMMNSPHSWLDQNDASIYQSMDSVFAQYRNNTLSLSATSTVPSSHGSDYGFGNAANSRLGYEDVSRNHLPSNSSVTSSTRPFSHGSAFGFDMTSGNATNTKVGYHLPSNSSGASSVPSSHGSDYGFAMSSGKAHLPSNSSGISSHRSAFGFDMTSGNAPNSRLGYEDFSRNHLPSNSSVTSSTGPYSHGGGMSSGNGSNSRLGYEDVSRIQGTIPFVWRVEGEDSYRSIQPHNQQERAAYFERLRADLLASSLDQEFNRNHLSDHTQQRPRDK